MDLSPYQLSYVNFKQPETCGGTAPDNVDWMAIVTLNGKIVGCVEEAQAGPEGFVVRQDWDDSPPGVEPKTHPVKDHGHVAIYRVGWDGLVDNRGQVNLEALEHLKTVLGMRE